MMPRLLTIDDITKELCIGKTTAYRLVRKISHTKIGRRILVREDDLLSYIQNRMSNDTDCSE